jgi:hypothetical protein
VLPPDGESFVRNVAEFFAQVVTPDTDGIFKPPDVLIENESVADDLETLESVGASVFSGRAQQTNVETAYVSAIESRSAPGTTVDTDWFDAAFPDARTIEQPAVDDGYSTAPADEITVSVDPVVFAVARLQARQADQEQSVDAIATEALRSFLAAVPDAEPAELEQATDVTTTHSLQFDASPALEAAIDLQVRQSDSVNTGTEFVEEVLLDWLSVDPDDASVTIAEYPGVTAAVRDVIDRDHCSCTTPDGVVQAALEVHLDLRC